MIKEYWACVNCAELMKNYWDVKKIREAAWDEKHRCELCRPKSRAKTAFALFRLSNKFVKEEQAEGRGPGEAGTKQGL